jgi:GGDEF domain-containing protein
MAESSGTPRDFEKRKGEETYQEDWDLAWDAAHALKAETEDPQTRVKPSVFLEEEREGIVGKLKNLWDRLQKGPQRRQEHILLFLEATEREIKRGYIDTLCGDVGVLNRGGIEGVVRFEALKNRIVQVSKERRHEESNPAKGFIVAIFDIDGLKTVNDFQEGNHALGDRLIVGVADQIRQTLRATDWIGRIGGDEFFALLPVDSEQQAQVVMEEGKRNRDGSVEPGIVGKIKERVERFRGELRKEFGNKFPPDDPDRERGRFPGQVSVGWHYFNVQDFEERYRGYLDSPPKGRSFVAVLAREADQAMYEMKHGKPTQAPSPDAPK